MPMLRRFALWLFVVTLSATAAVAEPLTITRGSSGSSTTAVPSGSEGGGSATTGKPTVHRGNEAPSEPGASDQPGTDSTRRAAEGLADDTARLFKSLSDTVRRFTPSR